MPLLSLCFQCHQPFRLNPYTFFQIGSSDAYFNDKLNRSVINDMAERCYLPANQMMSRLIKSSEGQFKISLALSGPFLRQLQDFRPDVLESFKRLVATGCVELLAQTSHHSIASLFSPEEFISQVKSHSETIQEIFGITPKVLWNTEMLYSDAIAEAASCAGIEGVLADGIEFIRNGRSPNELYFPQGSPEMITILRHHELSLDFSDLRNDPEWAEFPLAPEKFESWIGQQPGHYVNICANYEIFDLVKDPAAFSFFRDFIETGIDYSQPFTTPSRLLLSPAKGPLPCRHPICTRGDGSIDQILGHVLQKEAARKIYQLAPQVNSCSDPDLADAWKNLQSVDHFYYMNPSCSGKYQPYPSAYEAYNFYTNVLADVQVRIRQDLSILNASLQRRNGIPA